MTTVRAFHAAFGVKVRSFYGTSETGGIAFDDSPELVEDGTRRAADARRHDHPHDPKRRRPPGGGRVHVAGTAVSSGYVGGNRPAPAFTTVGF